MPDNSKKIDRLKSVREIMSLDTKFVGDFLSEIPIDITHSELFALAVDVLVSACPSVKARIWEVKASDINIGLLQDRMLSSGERLVAQAAISLWTYGISSVELWTLINKLDAANSRNLMRALMLVHYWDAAERD